MSLPPPCSMFTNFGWVPCTLFDICEEAVTMARTKSAPRKVSRSTLTKSSKQAKGDLSSTQKLISSLPDETHSLIFSIISDADSSFINPLLNNEWDPDLIRPSPLDDIRSASQVCKRWRKLILKSPSLWGNAIELESLNQRGDKWRTEVLKRTGRAPLTVVGIQRKSEPSTRFLAQLLDHHWERIRNLCIYGEDCGVEDTIWRALQSPAPKLECCILNFSTNTTKKTLPFSDAAPRLRYFSVPGIRMKFQSSWTSKIKHLWIVNTPLVPVSQVLRAIGEMSLLESLIIKNSLDSDESRQSWSTVRMPLLTTIRFQDNFPSLGILSRIIPSRHCSMDIESADNEVLSLVWDDISDIAKTFGVMFTASAFTSIEDLIIDVDATTLHIGDMDNASDKQRTFDLRIGLNARPTYRLLTLWCRIISLALEAASKSDLSRILSLCIDGASDYFSETSLPVHAFLRNLRRVYTLHANSATLKFLAKTQTSLGRKGFDILPGLNEVILDDEDLRPEAVLQFLLIRRDAGRVLGIVDIGSKDPGLFERLRFMMGFPGLKVVRS